MRVLGIDTATAIACVGIVADGAATERRQPMASSHARTLLPLVDAVLDGAGIRVADLDLLAVSIGPGSFTGLRIGLSVVKGLALAVGAPVVGVPTLRAYAFAVGPRPGPVWPVLDARKGEVYAASYGWCDGTLRETLAPVALAPDRLGARLAVPCTLVGDGVDAYGDRWAADAPGVTLLPLAASPPSGAAVARLGTSLFEADGAAELARLEPQYCRLSEAEIHRTAAVSAR